MALSDVYIARAYRSILEDTEGVVLPIWSLIETRCDITPTEVRLQIMATTLNQDEAEKIQATVGDPALRITLHDLTDRSEIYEVAQTSVRRTVLHIPTLCVSNSLIPHPEKRRS